MSWFRSKQRGNRSPHPELRRSLLAAAPLHEVGDLATDDPDTPQSRFHAALAALSVGDRDRARAQLQALLQLDEADARLAVQAWSCLRELGATPPPAQADRVRGVVVETGSGGLVETTAAYIDLTAVVVCADGETLHWSEPDCGIDELIEELLSRAGALAGGGTPLGVEPGAPVDGQASIAALTFGGARLRVGLRESLQQDEVTGPLLQLSQRLAAMVAERRATARSGH